MAQPTPYVRQYDLASVQSGNSLIPIPGSYLDQELNAVKHTLDQTLANLARIQRDDGALANGIVGVAALSSDVKALMATGAAIQGSWVTGTTYLVGNIVENSANAYFCLDDHVAGASFATDLGAGLWVALTSSTPVDGSISTAKLADLAVTTAKLAADAVTFAKMQNITSDRLVGRDTASSGDPEEISVGGGLEFTGSGGIQRSALSGDVTAAAGANTTAIGDNVVTYAKMQNVTTFHRLLGRNTLSAGDPEEVTAEQVLDWLAGTQGDILFRGPTAWQGLGAGTDGQFLKTQGPGASPVWAAPVAAASVARAWVYSDGNGSIQAAYNVSAVIAHGLGHYSIGFTSPLPSANYAVIGMGEAVDGFNNTQVAFRQGDAKSTTGCQIRVKRLDVGVNSFFSVMFFGS